MKVLLPLRIGVILGCLLGGLAAPCVWAQPETSQQQDAAIAVNAWRKSEYERIRQHRAALAAQRAQDEAQCYQRFAVEDCLRGVRARLRLAETRLRQQEVELNDAERKEKAAARLRSIDEKRSIQPPAAPLGAGAQTSTRRTSPDAPEARVPRERAPQKPRAAAQPPREAAGLQEAATRSAENAQRAAQARERHAETLRDAQERRERVEKAQAEAAASGRKPAAALPVPSTSPASSAH